MDLVQSLDESSKKSASFLLEGLVSYLYPKDGDLNPDQRYWFDYTAGFNQEKKENGFSKDLKQKSTTEELLISQKLAYFETSEKSEKSGRYVGEFAEAEFFSALARVLFRIASMKIAPKVVINDAKIADRPNKDFEQISGKDMDNWVALQKNKGFLHIKNGRTCSESLSGNYVDLIYHRDTYYLYDIKKRRYS